MSDPAPLIELLRSKAMLLLRREREVIQLRQERSRVELWLNVFHELSLELNTRKETLLGDWALAMVDKLGFQVAAAYACDPASEQMTLLAGQAHVTLAPVVTLPRALQAELADQRAGSRIGSESHTLDVLAESLGLESFFWQSLRAHAKSLLFVAGFGTGTATFHALNEYDFSHFVFSGKHMAALLENVALIEELDRERSEISESNAELDRSVQSLRDAQAKLLQSTRLLAEVSRRAGMADIATGVLHNVGNVLNSVNVSAEIAAERLRALKISGVKRVAELLEKDASLEPSPASQSRKVAHYLHELGNHLLSETAEIATELRSLQQNIDHIKSIVSKQQAYARSTLGVAEPCAPGQLMDDAIGLTEDSSSHHGIQVVRDYSEASVVLLDRHKVLQILVNLVSNAKHALAESSVEPRLISLSVRRPRADRIRLVVGDNGVGISTEHLSKVFTHGFTTRENGHGFGLHTSALSAREMGGELTCRSAGRGFGATFVLELPARLAEIGERAS